MNLANSTVSTALAIIAVIILLIVLVGLGGILTILSINALFGTAITITFWNWAAATWLTAVFAPVRYKLNLNK